MKPGGTYTVGDGETLYGICFKLYGNIRHLDDILAVNHLTDENRIIAGQTLVLPVCPENSKKIMPNHLK